MARNGGMSNKELIIEMRTDMKEMRKSMTAIENSIDERLNAIEAEVSTQRGQIEVYLRDRKYALGGALSIALVVFGALLPGCQEVTPSTPRPETEQPVATRAPIPTELPTATASATPTPAPTPTVAYTLTPDWSATPTMYTPGAIIEVTAVGDGYQWSTPTPKNDWQPLPDGTLYSVFGVTKVRACPSVQCGETERYAAGKQVPVFDLYRAAIDEQWLCLTTLQVVEQSLACNKAIAYYYQGRQIGELIWPGD